MQHYWIGVGHIYMYFFFSFLILDTQYEKMFSKSVFLFCGAILLRTESIAQNQSSLKVDMPILTCIFFNFNWLTLISEIHFVTFHPEVASCLLSRGKRKYAPLGMRLIWKYIRNYILVYQLISHFLSYLQNYTEFKANILDLQPEKYGLHLISKNVLLPVEPWGMRMWSA